MMYNANDIIVMPVIKKISYRIESGVPSVPRAVVMNEDLL